MIHDFRRLVRKRLGDLGVAVLNARLAGEETKSLVGRAERAAPESSWSRGSFARSKELAAEYARSLGDSELLRRIERAMASEEETVAKRQATTAARRQRVGA